MTEYTSDSLLPRKHGKISPFAFLVWSLIALVAVAVVILTVTKFDIARLRGADHFISKARQAVVAKDWPAAIWALQHVAVHVRERDDYLRVLADFLEASRSDPVLLDGTLVKLDAKGLMQPEDFIWACRLRLAAGNILTARKFWDRIPAPSRQTLEGMKLTVALLKEEGRPQEAVEAERLLFERFADDPEIAVFKAVQDLEGTFPEIEQAALSRLWELARRADEPGAMAIRVLSHRQDLTLPDSKRLHELADKQPCIAMGDRLPIISTLMRLDPPQRGPLLAAEVKRYENGDAAQQIQLASWLALEKEYDKVMALVPEDMLMKSPDLFPQVAQGLAEKGKWADLLKLVQKGKKVPVSNARASTWRALATKNLQPENAKEIRAHIEEAIRESQVEKSGLAMMGAARLAEEWSMADLALKAYEVLAVPGSVQEAEMLDRCWQAAIVLKDSTKLLQLADKRARLKPGNFQLILQRDYMHLLCGDQVETVLVSSTAGAGVPAAEQESDAFQLLLALKAYRLHDLPLLTIALGKVRNARALNTGERAVYAGLQAVNGQPAPAYQMAESVRPELLLNEEAVFLGMAF
jgi:hypothetical protein